jgi:hypothetical protein
MPTKVPEIKLPEGLKRIRADHEGIVVVSDIDKTYLATQIDSIGGLLKTAFETAESKANVPGFSIVLRALRRGSGVQPEQNPLLFVSASPPQMRDTLLSKMELDEIEHEGIIFKNQLEHVRAREFKKLREQIGYKLSALLALWTELPKKSKLVLFGDDSESDPVIYSLFADILSHAVRGKDLAEMLSYLGVFREEAGRISELADTLGEACHPVQLVFINLAVGSQHNYYARFGPRFFASDNSLQVALTLFEHGLIRERAVRSVGREMVLFYDFEGARILESLKAGALRGLYGMETLHKLWPMLHAADVLPPPEAIGAEDGALTRLNPARWELESGPLTLKQLKRRYSEEGRY